MPPPPANFVKTPQRCHDCGNVRMLAAPVCCASCLAKRSKVDPRDAELVTFEDAAS
jgi:hypothetical protein